MPNCNEPGCGFNGTLRQLKRHFKREHSGETWTPDEHLPDHDSEQLDFDGEEPDESGHDPEQLVENDTTDTEGTSIFDYDDDTD